MTDLAAGHVCVNLQCKTVHCEAHPFVVLLTHATCACGCSREGSDFWLWLTELEHNRMTTHFIEQFVLDNTCNLITYSGGH